MSVTYGFYNSKNGDRRYDAIQMSSIFDGIIEDGILQHVGTAMVVKEAEGMVINVGAGRAWFNHTWTLNDSILPLTIPQSELLLNRYDAVVLEVDTREFIRANSIKIVKGKPGSYPVKPAMISENDRWQYPLAYIYVAAGVTSIRQANIENCVGTSACPFVTAPLEKMSINDLIEQWKDQWDKFSEDSQQEFIDWFNRLKDILSEEPVGNLINLIDAVEIATSSASNNLALTNTKTDLLDVDLIHPASAKNKVHKIGTGNASTLSNSPVKTGHFYGKWECIFHTVSGSNSRVMVKITEFYPVQGRVWFNHYNWTSWSGWFSEEEARNRLSRDIGTLSSLNTGNKENVVNAINWLKSHIDAYNTANLTSSTFATLKEFVVATSKANMVPKLLRFRDSGGWGPLGGSSNWYRAIVFYQNPYVAGVQYTVGGDVLFYCGGGTSIYYGHIEGTYDADNLTITYFRVFTSDSGCFVNSAQAIKANTGRHVAAGALGVKEIYNEVKNELTANNKQFYFDYKNGKYGFNTDPNRGADTFSPFSNGGSVLLVSLHNSTGSLSGFVPTAAPPYPETLINGDGMQTLIEADSFKVASATELVCNKSGTLHLLGQTYVSGGAHHYYLTKNGVDNLVPNSYNHLKYSIGVQKGDKIKIKWTRTAAYAIVATFVLAL